MNDAMTRTTLAGPGVRCARIALVAMAMMLFAPAGYSDSAGRCVSVEVDGEIVLPDGDIHPSGKLTLCNSKRLTPVAAIHKTYVNGRLVGMHLGRPHSSESREATPVVFFHRNGAGQLELQGYVFPGRGGDVTYTLTDRDEQEIRPGGTGPELLVAMAAAPASR